MQESSDEGKVVVIRFGKETQGTNKPNPIEQSVTQIPFPEIHCSKHSKKLRQWKGV